jgi:hypothetical protein
VIARRRRTTDDLISRSTRRDRRRAAHRRRDRRLAALFNGGHGTTTTSSADRSSLPKPDERQRLIDDPRLRSAVEEPIRFVAPVQGLMRTVTRDVGHARFGDKLMVLIAAATAPSDVRGPDRLDLSRHRHVGFGVGVHFASARSSPRGDRVVLDELPGSFPITRSGEIHYETSCPFAHRADHLEPHSETARMFTSPTMCWQISTRRNAPLPPIQDDDHTAQPRLPAVAGRYWRDGRDWRSREAAMNQLAHTHHDRRRTHFVHERGRGPTGAAQRLAGRSGITAT